MFKEVLNFGKWSVTEKWVFVIVVFLGITHAITLAAMLFFKLFPE